LDSCKHIVSTSDELDFTSHFMYLEWRVD